MDEKLKRLEDVLCKKGYSIGTIENCTCGLVGAAIGSVCPYQSVYKGTITAFNDNLLRSVSNITEGVIENNGLYSAQSAMQIALDGLSLLNTDICICVIGNASLDDGSIWVCCCKCVDGGTTFRYAKIDNVSERSVNIENAINGALKAAYALIIE